MKKLTLAVALLLLTLFTHAQNMKSSNDLEARVKLIEDRLALKELVDVFSNLADQKDVEKQKVSLRLQGIHASCLFQQLRSPSSCLF